MYDQVLTTETLPSAVANIFALNNYDCEENLQIHGSQIDIVARAKGDPFAPNIYIEVTVSYVDNLKYALDLTKFVVALREDPSCICLCVSLDGFTAAVKERAKAAGVKTQTYHELLRSFEKFTPYIDKIISNKSITTFEATYEEPLFDDGQGKDGATAWLAEWASNVNAKHNWIVILGEYGTGKTALTRVVQLRMLKNYLQNPSYPLPVRIELRDFTRQFDARTLLHNFLDRNGLSHVSIDYFFYLIRTRRVVLLLDGYDEMAQFLNVRERRACLSALADLASEGAKGILTSRPNYFSEEEELSVFEALYQNIHNNNYYISSVDMEYLNSEKTIDQLLNKYVLEKFERYLRDLDSEQTISLVRRKLSHDISGQAVVISVLQKVFREKEPGVRSSLAGKPVIITYMLDLVENIKQGLGFDYDYLTEWSIYKLIVDQLMLRDQQRTPGIYPTKRRSCLQKLAITLSQRDTSVAYDETFHSIIESEFRSDLRTLESDQAIVRRNELFENLRSSSTLTRTEGRKLSGWMFSHNSLREYLVAETYVQSAKEGKFAEIATPITQAMRSFVAAMNRNEFRSAVSNLMTVWSQRTEKRSIGTYLTLFWDSLVLLAVNDEVALRKYLPSVLGHISFENTRIKELSFRAEDGDDLKGSHFNSSDLSEVTFKNVNLSNSSFSESFLDAIVFSQCNLSGCSFRSAWLFDCDITECEIRGADFREISEDSSIYIYENTERVLLSGNEALGYLAFHGAIVNDVDDYFILKHHPKFDIILKICEKLAEQRNRQEIGLVQKGAARKDPPLAQEFLALLIKNSWAEYDRTMVAVTAEGRGVIREFIDQNKLPKEISDFLRAN